LAGAAQITIKTDDKKFRVIGDNAKIDRLTHFANTAETGKNTPLKKGLVTHDKLFLPRHILFFHKSNRHELIRRRANVVQGPVLVVLGKHVPDTLRPVDYRDITIFPIEQLNPVMNGLFLTVNGYLDLDVLFTTAAWNGYSDKCHSVLFSGEEIYGCSFVPDLRFFLSDQTTYQFFKPLILRLFEVDF
jgi:hypothetical protein